MAWSVKEIMNFIKIKNFCSTKVNITRMRRQASDQEKIYAKDTSDKELLFKICKHCLKLNNGETDNGKMGYIS